MVVMLNILYLHNWKNKIIETKLIDANKIDNGIIKYENNLSMIENKTPYNFFSIFDKMNQQKYVNEINADKYSIFRKTTNDEV